MIWLRSQLYAATMLLLIALAASLNVAGQVGSAAKATATPLLELGYRQMYNLQFDEAHRTFSEARTQFPNDPMVPVSNAAAYLFAEFDRLHVLESELFVDDDAFESRVKRFADPRAKQDFDRELQVASSLATTALEKNPRDSNALFAKVMTLGLMGDYTALIEKKDLKGLGYVKEGRSLAEKLLQIDPTCYDAYIAVGVENYLLSQKSAPLRWFLHMTGAQTDKETGLQKLRITATKGHYLLPYARMLLAVAALRDKRHDEARTLLEGLSREFPHNHLYATELAKLTPPVSGRGQNFGSN